MDNWTTYVALAVFALYFGLTFVWPIIDSNRKPASDIPRIKRSLGGEAHRVIQITPLGGDVTFSRSGGTAYRQYRVEVELPDHSRQTRLIDLQPSLLGDATLWEWRGGFRQRFAHDF